MQINILLWLYLINGALLINHEVDSAYWNEWKLFRMKGGVAVFLIIHFPIWLVLLYGVIEVLRGSFAGIIISVVMSSAGICAFFIHGYFIRKGNKEFTTPISRFILIGALIASIAQMSASIYYLFKLIA